MKNSSSARSSKNCESQNCSKFFTAPNIWDIVIVCFVLLAVIAPATSFGIAPHQLLVLANRNEPTSVSIAKSYVRNRNIPRQNLVLLDITSSDGGRYESMTREDFTSQIWDPARIMMSHRDLSHILAWVYSTHIPFRVDANPPVSIHGLTFARNNLPIGSNDISRAEYVSPLFAGPSAPGGPSRPPMGLSVYARQLKARMPIPSMSLGYVGERGNTEAEVRDCLHRSIAADATSPTGAVFFIMQDDIRSKVRRWQIEPVVETLKRVNVSGFITNGVPQNQRGVLGVMMGKANVSPLDIGLFTKGSIGEHLTSFGATFDQPSQTKISRWISAGVSGTAGTVCEPLAIWAKFPHARMYEHYTAGCSLIESFYASVRMPLQTYFVGDPLTAPWKADSSMRVIGITEGGVVQEDTSIDLYIQAPAGVLYSQVQYFLNGKLDGEGERYILKPQALSPGLHTFRAVAYEANPIRNSVSAEVRFRVVE